MRALLKEYISLFLSEKRVSGFAKAGDRADAYYSDLEKYVRTAPPYYYIHFSDINKVGINPQYGYLTPFGIYAWILNPLMMETLKKGGEVFASERACVHILEATVGSNEILVLQDVQKSHVSKLLAALKTKWTSSIPETQLALSGSIDEYFKQLIMDAKEISSAGDNAEATGSFYWQILTLFCDGDVKLWRRILLSLGYKGVLDVSNTTEGIPGIIYDSEPLQAVFFSKEYIAQVTTIQNPTSQQRCGDSMESTRTLITGMKDAKNINTKFLDFYWDKIIKSPLDARHVLLRTLLFSFSHDYDPYIQMLLGSIDGVSDILYSVSTTTDGTKNKTRDEIHKFWNFWEPSVGSFLEDYEKKKLKTLHGFIIYS